jgi:hypothetical protein
MNRKKITRKRFLSVKDGVEKKRKDKNSRLGFYWAN